MRVVDMECSVPKRTAADGAAPAAAPRAERPARYGMANYGRIFRSRPDGGDARPATELSAYVELLERVGIVRAVPFGSTNNEAAELLGTTRPASSASPASARTTACAASASWSAGCASDADQRIPGAAAQGRSQGEVALRQRRAGLRARVGIEGDRC